MEVEFTSEHCLRSEDQHGEGRSGMGAVREELQAEDGLQFLCLYCLQEPLQLVL